MQALSKGNHALSSARPVGAQLGACIPWLSMERKYWCNVRAGSPTCRDTACVNPGWSHRKSKQKMLKYRRNNQYIIHWHRGQREMADLPISLLETHPWWILTWQGRWHKKSPPRSELGLPLLFDIVRWRSMTKTCQLWRNKTKQQISTSFVST